MKFFKAGINTLCIHKSLDIDKTIHHLFKNKNYSYFDLTDDIFEKINSIDSEIILLNLSNDKTTFNSDNLDKVKWISDNCHNITKDKNFDKIIIFIDKFNRLNPIIGIDFMHSFKISIYLSQSILAVNKSKDKSVGYDLAVIKSRDYSRETCIEDLNLLL